MATVEDGPTITALAPWFGGKRTIAPLIVEELGPHSWYWDVFCGSMAIVFEKPPSQMETLNDLHGDLVNLARVVASDRWQDLQERLSRTTFCEDLFHDLRARLRGGECTDDVDRAFCFFVESWMGRNGVAGTRTHNTAFCVRYTSGGGPPTTRYHNAVDSIRAWNQRLRSACILQRDAFELLERIEDQPGTAIYCDPPYLVKGAKYVHDFADDDHDRLAKLLARFSKSRVVVSYYDHPRLAELYPPPTWTHRKIEVSKAMGHQGHRGENDTRAVEVLLMNGPSFARPEERRLFA
jgi:DNA adenine methylase